MNQKIIEYDTTLNLIRAMGVPETRSKSLIGSFTTLISRIDKELYWLKSENSRLKKALDDL